MPRDVVRTGITGLDTILLGGLPRGNIAVVTGGPGTGKSTLGTEFVYRGAHDYSEPGLIVSFEVSSERIVADAGTLGWELHALEQAGRIRIVSTTRSVFLQEIQEEDSLLLTEAMEIRARRIFVDGLAGMALNGNGNGNAHPRDVFQSLIEGLHRENLTAVFALDAAADRAGIGDVSEEFIADTIIRLGQEQAWSEYRPVARGREVAWPRVPGRPAFVSDRQRSRARGVPARADAPQRRA